MSAPEAFAQIYSERIIPAIEKLEPERKRLIGKLNQVYLAVAACIFSFVLLCINMPNPWVYFPIVFLCFAITVIFYKKYGELKRDFISHYKQEVIYQIVKGIDPALNYFPGQRVPEEYYDKSDIYPEGYDVYLGDDYVEGKMGRTIIMFSELEVCRTKGDDMCVLFKGIFFVADFNKNFLGRTYVWDRGERPITSINKDNFPFSVNIDKVLLESPHFNDKFIVYSNDQVEARYILSPTLMERMLKLSDHWNKNISFSFVNSNINIAIPFNEDLFEPDIRDPASKESLEAYYNLLTMSIGIVEELNLNLRIWNRN